MRFIDWVFVFSWESDGLCFMDLAKKLMIIVTQCLLFCSISMEEMYGDVT